MHKRKYIIGKVDLDKETEYYILFACFCIWLGFGTYTHATLGFHWANKFYLITPFIFTGLLLLQIKPVYESIIKIDYLKLTRKIGTTLSFSISLVCIWFFPIVYENYQFAHTQSKFTIKETITYTRAKGIHQEQVIFNFDNKKHYLSISNSEASRIEKGMQAGIEYCVSLVLQKGQYQTIIIESYTISSCK